MLTRTSRFTRAGPRLRAAAGKTSPAASRSGLLADLTSMDEIEAAVAAITDAEIEMRLELLLLLRYLDSNQD